MAHFIKSMDAASTITQADSTLTLDVLLGDNSLYTTTVNPVGNYDL